MLQNILRDVLEEHVGGGRGVSAELRMENRRGGVSCTWAVQSCSDAIGQQRGHDAEGRFDTGRTDGMLTVELM